ncbi:pig-Q [Dispira simplex]|nr:pig-Q [Dispira simplex]
MSPERGSSRSTRPVKLFWPRIPLPSATHGSAPAWLVGWKTGQDVFRICQVVLNVEYPRLQRALADVATHSLFRDIDVTPPVILGTLRCRSGTEPLPSLPKGRFEADSPLHLWYVKDGSLGLRSSLDYPLINDPRRLMVILFNPEMINFSFHLAIQPMILDITTTTTPYLLNNRKSQSLNGWVHPTDTSTLPSPKTQSSFPESPTTASSGDTAPLSLQAGLGQQVYLAMLQSLSGTDENSQLPKDSHLNTIIREVNSASTMESLLAHALCDRNSSWSFIFKLWVRLFPGNHTLSLSSASSDLPSSSSPLASSSHLADNQPSTDQVNESTGVPPPALPQRSSLWQQLNVFYHLVTVHILLYSWVLVRMLSELLLKILNFRFRRFMLKRSIAIGQQIDFRLHQITNTPWHYIMLRRRYWHDPCRRTALYVNFYNHLWQILGDIFIGLLVRQIILEHAPTITNVIHSRLHYYAVTSLESMIEWLMGWPAGMKLNPQLDPFLGELFLWLIRLWTELIHPAKPVTLFLVQLIGRCGILGASIQVALLSDYISIVTLHIYWFYAVAARIYHWQLSILYSLMNLFRGRRINPLRCRVDSCNYELDQLLLGTILFSLVFFLFPTIAVYYLTFAISRVGIIVIQGALEMIMAALNHFPFFALVLRLLLPRKFPGGVKLVVTDVSQVWASRLIWYQPWTWCKALSGGHSVLSSKSESTTSGSSTASASTIVDKTVYLSLSNNPLPVSAVFFEYLQLWRQLGVQYFGFSIMRCFITGELIRPVPRLQYATFPDTRPNFDTLRQQLTSHATSSS